MRTVLATVLLASVCAHARDIHVGKDAPTIHAAIKIAQPGDTNCEPKPVQGTIQFTQDGDVVSTVRINAGGDFTVEVPVGIYTVKVDIGDSIFPLCTPVEVEVRANAESVVEILCDTGIR